MIKISTRAIEIVALMILLMLSGCIPKYIQPTTDQPSAAITFERNAKHGILGSSTILIALDDDFVCDPSKNITKQQKIATIDKGNPLVKDTNQEYLYLEPEKNFRLLIRNVAGPTVCDVVLGFEAKQNREYSLLANVDFTSKELTCSVTMNEISGDESVDVDFSEYKSCGNIGELILVL